MTVGVFADPRTQYLTVDGKSVAVRSEFTFFEADSSDPKAIFSDIGEKTPISNVQLTDDRGQLSTIYYTGSARVTRFDAGEIFRFDIDNVISLGSVSAFPQWNQEVFYSLNDIVQGDDGNLYRSLQSGNLGNNPTSPSPSFWSQIEFNIVFNLSETYSTGDIVIGSDGQLYSSQVDDNIGNDPTTDGVNWAPAVERPSSTIFAFNNLGGFN